jgi:CBS domain-containing protein
LQDRVVPVESFDGTIAGLVNVDTLRAVPAHDRAMRRVADYTVPLSAMRAARPDETLADVMLRPGRARVDHVVVFDGDRLVGIVSPESVAARQGVSPATP